MPVMRKLLSTREGTLGFAVLAGVLAVVVILVFMRGYKRTLNEGSQPVTVLVAKGALPKGSSGDLIARKGLYQATALRREQIKEGALTDPASFRGMVATHEIVRGQQLTVADFARPTDPVLSKLGEDQRAVTIPLDTAHGMIGQVQAGDRVDVFAGFQVQPEGAGGRPRAVLRVLLQDVEVLKAPSAGGKSGGGLTSSSQTQNVVLRVKEKDAPQLAFSSDNGKVWISLRPQAGAKQDKPSLVTLDRLLLGLEPIPVDRFLANKRGLIQKVYRGDF
jgi:Flp pilus assembly protein CpaB